MHVRCEQCGEPWVGYSKDTLGGSYALCANHFDEAVANLNSDSLVTRRYSQRLFANPGFRPCVCGCGCDPDETMPTSTGFRCTPCLHERHGPRRSM